MLGPQPGHMSLIPFIAPDLPEQFVKGKSIPSLYTAFRRSHPFLHPVHVRCVLLHVWGCFRYHRLLEILQLRECWVSLTLVLGRGVRRT